MSFEEYLQLMLKKYNVSIAAVSRASWISEEYCYKLFRGTKHTAVRDYVIGICRAIGMSDVETATAMTLNNMQIFQADDARDQIILRCIRDNRNIRMLNESLEEAGYKPLQWCC